MAIAPSSSTNKISSIALMVLFASKAAMIAARSLPWVIFTVVPLTVNVPPEVPSSDMFAAGTMIRCDSPMKLK